MTFLLALWSLQPIQLTVSPHIAVAPATIRLQIRMQPIASDRHVRVEADGEHFFRASEFTIDGAQAPKLQSWTLKDLPAGLYEVTAGIGPWGGFRAVDRTTVEIH